MDAEGCKEFEGTDGKKWRVDPGWADGHPIPRANKKGTGGPSGPDFKEGFLRWLKVHRPEKTKTELTKFGEKHNWTIIYTPPYCPKLQPIELFWCHGKSYVANQYNDKRTFKDLLPALRTGWYGGWDNKGGLVGACDVGNLVAHARKEMDLEVKSVGWEGKVGSLDRSKYSAPITELLEGLAHETANGGFNIATNLSGITPDTTNDIDINANTDEEDCEPDSDEEGGDDVSDADDYE